MSPLRDRRVLIAAVGAVVGVALVAFGLLSLGGDDGYDPEDLPAVKPLALTLPKHFDNVFSVSGAKSGLTGRDRQAVIRVIEGYLRGATIKPLEDAARLEGDDAKRPAPASYLQRFFSSAAQRRIDNKRDVRALSDAHLPAAEYGVSTDYAKASLSALVDRGRAQVVAAHFDARMRVRTGELEDGRDAVVVRRVGDLVLEPGRGGFRITSYRVTVRRTVGTTTTTTEAAFGETTL